MQRLAARALVVLTPWRLAARQAPVSRLRFALTAWAVGLGIAPAMHLGGWLSRGLARHVLQAPQADLVEAVADGLFAAEPLTAGAALRTGLGWLAGGLAAGLLGALLSAFLLLGLSPRSPSPLDRRVGYALGRFGLGYALLGVAGFACLGADSAPGLAVAIALCLACVAGAGALGLGAFRLAGATRARALVNAALYGFATFWLMFFALELAVLSTFLPEALAQRLAG